jgi:hypothetical protein
MVTTMQSQSQTSRDSMLRIKNSLKVLLTRKWTLESPSNIHMDTHSHTISSREMMPMPVRQLLRSRDKRNCHHALVPTDNHWSTACQRQERVSLRRTTTFQPVPRESPSTASQFAMRLLPEVAPRPAPQSHLNRTDTKVTK